MAKNVVAIWDLDGTVITYRNPNRERFAEAIRHVTGSAPDFSERSLVGATDLGILAKGLESTSDDPSALQVVAVRQLELEMRRNIESTLRSYGICPGVEATLDALKAEKVHQTIATGNTFFRAVEKVNAVGLMGHFEMAWGAYGDETRFRSELVKAGHERAALRLGVPTGDLDAVVIGDSPADADAAESAGFRCILIASGHYSVAELSHSTSDLVLPSLDGAFERMLDVFFPRPGS